MPDCCVDTALVAAAISGYRYYKGSVYERQERERRKKMAILLKISSQTINRTFEGSWPVTSGVDRQLPLGSDSSAAAALRAVQEYQDQRGQQKSMSALPSLPTCSVGPFTVGGGGCSGQDSRAPSDAETVVCEELKKWLLSAATGAVPAKEASLRVLFYSQILMRPEVFKQAGFLPLISVVCGRLHQLATRLAGTMRTCALQITKVVNIGRDVINGLMPLLVLAITATEGIANDSLPLLCVDVLKESALRSEVEGGSRDVLATLWAKDSGRLLRELLLSRHMKKLWRHAEQDEEADSRLPRAERLGVLAMKVELYHKWEDALTEGRQAENSGLFGDFAKMDTWSVQKAYLSLFEKLDFFVECMHMLEPYKAIANFGGDAMMYHMQGMLHHLLQEAELSLVQISRDASRIMDAVKRNVITGSITDPSPSTNRIGWLERLQLVDEQAQGQAIEGFAEALTHLRYLTSDAHRPELQADCRRALGQIVEMTQSKEFRSRCIEKPPEPSQQMLAGLEALEGGAAATAAAENLALTDDEGPAWSVERQFPVEQEEVVSSFGSGAGGSNQTEDLLGNLGPEMRSRCVGECRRRDDLGELVQRLNRGAISDPGDFYVVLFADTQDCIGLFKPNKRQVAVEALGLNRSTWAQPAQVVTLDSGLIAVAAGEQAPASASAPPAPPRAPEPAIEPAVAAEPLRPAAPAPPMVTTPARPAEPARPPAVPSRTAPAVPVGAAEREGGAVSQELQDVFYQVLFSAVLPLLGGEDAIVAEQAMLLLRRAEPEIHADTLRWIVEAEMQGNDITSGLVDRECLQRIGQLVAHAQAGCTNLAAVRGVRPDQVPRFRGLLWDARRKKVAVLEPF